MSSKTHSLREDLRVIALSNLSDLVFGSGRVDNPVLSLDPVLDLFPELLLNDLVLLEQRGKSSLDGLGLCLLCLVSLGELEEVFDLVFALFTGRSGLFVELVCVAGSSRVGRSLQSAPFQQKMRTKDCW